ncbi:MAG: diacylglycerol kinase family lipid kinase [Candidatus Marinimicrobia bacterium]|nr:diacylglycerol kinase family lipid kinase [Candidatus Neomarinimicrobiota bacterium]
MKRKYAIIVNPIAGHGKTSRRLPLLQEITRDQDADFDYYITEYPFHAAEIADQIHEKYDAVVAYGGDGTANEVMNGLAGTPTPFGIIPDGSGNDFARCIGVSKNLAQAVKTLMQYDCRLMDLGTIGDRLFLNGVGIGFDGYVNYRNKNTKLFRGALSYFITVLSSLAQWRPIPVQIEIDDLPVPNKFAYLLAIGNGSSSGGGLKLTPDAVINDGNFDICHIQNIPIWKILLNIGRLKTGTLGVVKEVNIQKGKTISVKSEVPLPIHFDGEVYDVNAKEVRVSIVPNSAMVIGEWNN